MFIRLCAVLLGLSSLHARDEFTYQQFIGCATDHQGPVKRFWRYGFNGKDIMDVDLQNETIKPKSEEGNFMAKERKSKVYFKHKELKLTKICSTVEAVFLKSNNSLSRTVKPFVTVSLEELDGKEYLACSVQGFAPYTISVRWVYRGSIVYFSSTSTGLLPLKDGTFQIISYLSPGNRTLHDIVCETEHISFEGKKQVTLEHSNSTEFLIMISIPSFLLPCLLPVGVTAFIVRSRKRTRSSVNDSLEQSSDDNVPAAAVGLMLVESEGE